MCLGWACGALCVVPGGGLFVLVCLLVDSVVLFVNVVLLCFGVGLLDLLVFDEGAAGRAESICKTLSLDLWSVSRESGGALELVLGGLAGPPAEAFEVNRDSFSRGKAALDGALDEVVMKIDAWRRAVEDENSRRETLNDWELRYGDLPPGTGPTKPRIEATAEPVLEVSCAKVDDHVTFSDRSGSCKGGDPDELVSYSQVVGPFGENLGEQRRNLIGAITDMESCAWGSLKVTSVGSAIWALALFCDADSSWTENLGEAFRIAGGANKLGRVVPSDVLHDLPGRSKEYARARMQYDKLFDEIENDHGLSDTKKAEGLAALEEKITSVAWFEQNRPDLLQNLNGFLASAPDTEGASQFSLEDLLEIRYGFANQLQHDNGVPVAEMILSNINGVTISTLDLEKGKAQYYDGQQHLHLNLDELRNHDREPFNVLYHEMMHAADHQWGMKQGNSESGSNVNKYGPDGGLTLHEQANEDFRRYINPKLDTIINNMFPITDDMAVAETATVHLRRFVVKGEVLHNLLEEPDLSSKEFLDAAKGNVKGISQDAGKVYQFLYKANLGPLAEEDVLMITPSDIYSGLTNFKTPYYYSHIQKDEATGKNLPQDQQKYWERPVSGELLANIAADYFILDEQSQATTLGNDDNYLPGSMDWFGQYVEEAKKG